MEQFLYDFPGFRWQDLVDILLNAYILFRLYVLFRGTNVFRVLLAVCLLWIVSRVASFLGLIITNWAMQGVITAATFVIIIVFRNEISSVVRTRNLKSFFWGIPRHQVNTPIEIVVDSVRDLAEKKIGALIVLPLKQGLDSFVRSGITLNGKLSKEALVSIFWPDNPLHDGAAIIQGNRITRAGVILPLSQKRDLDTSYGTRHRAALGLTELTDAIVIVVSEERGKISVLEKNRFHSIGQASDIQAVFKDYAGEDPKKRGLKRQTRELALAGMICLVCTIGIWYVFSRGMSTLSTHEVPIEFIKPDPKLQITQVSASEAKLLISGALPLIKALDPGQINIKLILPDSGAGNKVLPISPKDVMLPPGIQLKKIEPAQVKITLDALVEKELPIQPDWKGKLPKGFIMVRARTIPPVVQVKGGALALNHVSTIFTEKIFLDTLRDSGTIKVGLVLDSPAMKVETGTRVQVQYFISKSNPAI
ncbi:MAG: TIGR00159 family protein [Desulfobacter sp.]|nr:TIGR00159 family protein [Desulfobacter sp.]